jgi:hypothetical protein
MALSAALPTILDERPEIRLRRSRTGKASRKKLGDLKKISTEQPGAWAPFNPPRPAAGAPAPRCGVTGKLKLQREQTLGSTPSCFVYVNAQLVAASNAFTASPRDEVSSACPQLEDSD